jgi:hypothetical protein
MRKAQEPQVQFLTIDGIGPQLANALVKKRLRIVKKADAHPRAHLKLSGDVYADTIALGAMALLRHVEQLLSTNPLQVVAQEGSVLRIRVCGALDYVIDRDNHAVWVESSPLTCRERASKKYPPWDPRIESRVVDVDLLNPLCKRHWLVHIAARPDWFCYGPGESVQGGDQLFADSDLMKLVLERVVELVWSRLKDSTAMVALRHRLAATLTLHVGSRLISTAMRARVYPTTASLQARHLNLVWRHNSAFQIMEQENPNLLVALTAWLSHSKSSDRTDLADALPAMKADLLDTGLSPKAWRVLAVHGLKRLLPSHQTHSIWHSMIGTLKALQTSRWPAVPPQGFIRLMLDAAGRPDSYDSADIGVPGWFWHYTCNEANAVKGNTTAYQALFDSIPRWAWLVRKYGICPDKNQRRKGIAWLRAAAQHYEKVEQQDHTGDIPSWSLWIQSAEWDTVKMFAVIPLLSPNSMVNEAVAMHNCADSYIGRCQTGNTLLLSLGDLVSGKRVALASTILKRDVWVLGQVVGPCNAPVAEAIRDVAKVALNEVNWQYKEHLLRTEVSEHVAN